MGLFDKFKKKKAESSSIATDFEILLEKAAKDPAYRVEFYKRLLSEDLVLIIKDSQIPEGVSIAKEDTKVSVYSFDDKRTPIFTSTERIFDRGVVKEQVSFMKLKGEAIFKMLQGKTLILNPYSNHGKELLPAEMESLLDGSFFTKNVEQVNIKARTTFAIGQPTVYPTGAVNSLIELFSNRPNVNAAYLGLIYSKSAGDEPPHYIFSIDAVGDWASLVQEAAFTVKQILVDEKIIDFTKIGDDTSITNYMLNQTTPFYRKS